MFFKRYFWMISSWMIPLVGLTILAQEVHTSYLPHFSQKANEWHTRIGLYNPSSTTAEIEMSAFGNDGTLLAKVAGKLAAHGDWSGSVWDLMGTLPQETGWIQFLSDDPAVSGVVTFQSLEGGGITSVPLNGETSKGLIFPMLETTAVHKSGIALINPNAVSCNVSLRVSGLDRQRVQTKSLLLNPGEKRVAMVSDWFPQALPSKFSMEVIAEQPITGFGLTFQGKNKQIFALPANSWDPGFLPELRQLVEYWHGQASIRTGLSFAVDHPQWGTVVAAAGKADVEQNTAMQVDTLTEIGSITKSFIAALFLKFQEEQRLNLNDRLEQYLPGLPHGSDIPLRWLLNHQSGMPNYTEIESWNPALAAYFFDGGPVWSPQRILEEAMSQPWLFEPGTRFSYSNTNYLVLAMIAEKIGEKPLGEQLREQFWSPLGMDHTFMAHSESTPERAQTYLFDDESDQLINVSSLDQNWLWGSSMVSSAEDLVTWTKALLGGQVLQPQSLDEMLTPGTANQEEPGYGLGMGIHTVNGASFFSHSGQTLGATAQMIYLPEKQITICFLMNNTFEDEAYTQLFIEVLQKLSTEAAIPTKASAELAFSSFK